MKKVYKFATGVRIPEGAIYLKTIIDDRMSTRLVWHYFLVEVQE